VMPDIRALDRDHLKKRRIPPFLQRMLEPGFSPSASPLVPNVL
jgi:hypothetical protein